MASRRSATIDPQTTYTAQQLQPLLEALQAAQAGDFSVRLPTPKDGILTDISRAFNDMVGQNEKMAKEIVRVGRIVGREGRMTERAALKGAAGSWAVSIDSVNTLIEDLARPTTEVRRVITAVAEGDLNQKMALEIQGTPVKGEFLSIGTTVNTMVDQLSSFASEVTRVAREVGTDGILGGQANVKGVSGTWKDLTDSVNSLASNLTGQVRNIAEVTTAVANGDLSKKITVDVRGEILDLKDTINTMVDQLNAFASEVTRVAREVGTEGILGGQAEVKGVSGTWKDLTDSVNSMASNLTGQVRNIAEVTTAVANGDLSKKITVDVRGEILDLKDTINTMVDQLNAFASEVTRVAREVGTEGILGGQAEVKGVSGTWKDLTDSVNSMASNLTGQVRNIAEVTTAVANGDLSKKITVDVRGEILDLKDTINTMVDQLGAFASEVTRVAREVGTEGILGGQADVQGVSGTWKDLTDSVNFMASNLTGQVRNIAEVTTAVANGDLSKKITVDVRGEILDLKDTINTMVDQLNAFASEVTRVAREVGTEGILGGQAEVKGVSGTWKDLTDSVNSMASNLTGQVRNIAEVTTAVANGDLSKKITVDVKGEILDLKDTINTMVDQLNAFASEVTRVAREVGTEGILGGQANVRGVSGTWKDLTDSVNFMASNLTGQVRNIADVTTAVANGDLSKKITVDVRGEILDLKDTINTMVDQLNAFASEVTRVAREVGTEGRLGGQAEVIGVSGTWKDLTDSVNFMASNLTGQVRNIAEVTTAVANGDLSKKITVDVRGEILDLKNTINTMVDQLSSFASEVTRVAREVGTEGKLGGQAEVKGVAGTWKDLTDNVNFMASNLTGQVRNIAEVTTAVANGDLSKKITVDVKGEILDLKDTINTMVDQLGAFASEVTRVAREVGTEGILGGQADVRGVSGTWKDLTDSVNFMASNLTGQVRNIAEVTTAVANGDLSKKITVDVRGEILDLKKTINTMVDQLNAFASEVTRVAREVGTEGRLGGQAEVTGVSGTWKDLTDSVNSMASNLTGQVRNIAEVTTAVAMGDLSKKITVDVRGEILDLKNTINTMVDQLNAFASEVTRVAREVGTEGILGAQARVPNVAGTWKDLTDNVNIMASNLTAQVRNIAEVTTAVANGDLSKKITVDVRGEILDLKNTINTMVDQLNAFASEVTRVAREVGTEGILGGQANVKGVSGTWKDLTDNVNIMAGNLTDQVRNIAEVVTAVAMGDLRKKLVVEAKGEVAKLADTINNMTDTLSIFAQQVTTVAREVGTEGKLGGQAKVPNVAGTWKDLTDSVNSMANSLTVQVRAIADVATAVTEGDLTRTITVEAQGEVSTLKDNINQMIGNLKGTTLRNEQQDWLKTNLASFSRMMQGQKSLESVAQLIMSELTPKVSAHHGVFYINDPMQDGEPILKLISSYGYKERKNVSNTYGLGEGLVGQSALEKKSILLTNVPRDYIKITSGLGEATPLNIIVLPVMFEGEIMAVVELASFLPFSDIHIDLLEQLMESTGVVLNMIAANMRREELYQESQSLTQELTKRSEELQSQQEQLKLTNTALEKQAKELEEKATLLAEQNQQVEQKNREVELARAALQEKSDQLALRSDQLAQRSKYKSEFLANMSHELRTPLNSMLILAKLLADNEEGNLTPKQTKFASTIYSSGNDLLNLINEILDLSKVEAGKMDVDVAPVAIDEVQDYVERTFREIAVDKGLDFQINVEPDVPDTINTDMQRLQQVLRNLLSNAFKFTDQGQVKLEIRLARPTENLQGRLAYHTRDNNIIAFSVSDTGIGIPRDKQELIFAAFQQADGTTSRKYGGTGLGLSISRGITTLLGGTIGVESGDGTGSTFTLYLPEFYVGSAPTPSDDGYDYSNQSYDDNGYSGDNGYSSDNGYSRDGATTGRSDGLSSGRVAAPLSALPSGGSTSTTPVSASPTVADGVNSTIRGMSQASSPELAQPATQVPNEATMAALSSAASTASTLSAQRARARHELNDDRETLQASDQVLLIVEDDVNFARILLDMGRKRGFKVLVALDGDTGLAIAREYKPDAITLDLQLPLVDGWTVLDHLKRDPETRHIPVQVISVMDRQQGAIVGAIAYLEKPVSSDALEGALSHIKGFVDRDVRDLLIVEDNETQRNSIIELIGNQDVIATAVATGEEALAKLKDKRFDCMILDLGLPDMEGFELLKKVKRQAKYKDLPVVIYTSKDLSKREEVQLKKYAATIITKNPTSSERLLDETSLFLHRVISKMPSAKRKIVEQRHRTEPIVSRPGSADKGHGQRQTPPAPTSEKAEEHQAQATATDDASQSTTGGDGNKSLTGKTVLVVDDDMRNIFALTSVLENYGMQVLFAENGRDAINVLNNTTGIDVVLMDVMMPEMDGLETTQAIRQMENFAALPIIALTAKAMEGDREKCLAAGASDYIPKPVNIDSLIAMLRQWLSQEASEENSG